MRKTALQGGGLLVLALLGGCHLLIGYRDAVLEEGGEGGAGGTGGAGGGCLLNGIEDGEETARDCGGPACPPCEDGKSCKVGADCASGVCAARVCSPAACDDGVQNGAESDVDCGGSAVSGCAGCADGATCQGHRDCLSGVCKAGECTKSLLWARQFGPVEESKIAAAADGSICLVGLSQDHVNLGGGTLLVGPYDILGAGYDAHGQHRWSNVFGDAEFQVAADVAANSATSAVATGYFTGQLDFGGQPLTSAGSDDVFLVKLGLDGAHQWSAQFGDQQSQSGRAIALGPVDDVYLAGFYSGTINLGGGDLPAGALMGLVTRLDHAGGHVWSRGFPDIYPDYIAVDNNGNAFIAGTLAGSTNLGGGALPYSGNDDRFLLAVSEEGSHLWSMGFVAHYLAGMAVDNAGSMAVVGQFIGNLALPGVEMTSAGFPDTNNSDIFLVKLGADGAPRWSRQIGTTANDACWDLSIDPLGNIVLTCRLDEPADIGGVELQGYHLVKLDPDGKYLWSRRLSDESGGIGVSDLAVPDPEHVVLVGQLQNTFDLGGGPMTSQSYSDLVLARFLVPSGP